MKRIGFFWLALILWAFGTLANAQSPVTPGYTTNGSNWIAVSPTSPLPVTTDTSGSLPVPIASSSQLPLSISGVTTLTVPSTATQALICIETAAIRWTDDGTTPSTTVGQLLSIQQCKIFVSLALVKFNPATGSSANITVSYYK